MFFSEAQNCSLIGFLLLLMLVFYVMHMSADGQIVRLTKRFTIAVCVANWLILFGLHLTFAVSQYYAIRSLNGLYRMLQLTPDSVLIKAESEGCFYGLCLFYSAAKYFYD